MQQEDDPATVTLSALRRDRGRDKRVAVLVGGVDAVRASLESAIPYGEALEKSDILIVPLVLEEATRIGARGGEGAPARLRATGAENDLESAVGRPHVGMPVALNRWQEYIDTEVRIDSCWRPGAGRYDRGMCRTYTDRSSYRVCVIR